MENDYLNNYMENAYINSYIEEFVKNSGIISGIPSVKNHLMFESAVFCDKICNYLIINEYKNWSAFRFLMKLAFSIYAGAEEENKYKHHKNKIWLRKTLEECAEMSDGCSIKTMRRVIKKLKEIGILLVENLDETKKDMCHYYTIGKILDKEVTIPEPLVLKSSSDY